MDGLDSREPDVKDGADCGGEKMGACRRKAKHREGAGEKK